MSQRNKLFDVSNLLSVLALAFLAVACSDIEPQPSDTKKSNISSEERLILDYYKSVHPEFSTRASEELLENAVSIRDIEVANYEIESDAKQNAGSQIEKSTSFAIKTVSVDFGGSQGYAILSDDKRINKVFYYTESGSIADTAVIAPLKMMIEAYPEVAKSILADSDVAQVNKMKVPVESHKIVNPLVRFRWGQGAPFNSAVVYCTAGDCAEPEFKNHTPVGCVNVAVAQTIATLERFKGTYYGTRNIDFKKLPQIKELCTPADEVVISNFIQEIALSCQTKFDCGGSSVKLEAVENYLKELGYGCNHEKGSLNEDKTVELLKKGIPHIMAGSDKVGHAWIIDGVQSPFGNARYDYHCNWGQYGKSDGWTDGLVFKYFDYSKGTTNIYDHAFEHIYITSY